MQWWNLKCRLGKNWIRLLLFWILICACVAECVFWYVLNISYVYVCVCVCHLLWFVTTLCHLNLRLRIVLLPHLICPVGFCSMWNCELNSNRILAVVVLFSLFLLWWCAYCFLHCLVFVFSVYICARVGVFYYFYILCTCLILKLENGDWFLNITLKKWIF